MRVVIEVPDEFKALSTAVEALVTLVVAEGRRGAGGKAIDYGRVEQRVAAATAEVERAAHAGLLGGLDVDEPRVRIDRQTYTRVGRHAQTYYTLAGPVPVLRSVYRADGVRNGKVVDAVSLRAGVVADGWLPQTARAMAHEVQRGTARKAAASAAEVGRLPYSRSSFDRVTQAVGEPAIRSVATRNSDLGCEFAQPHRLGHARRVMSVATAGSLTPPHLTERLTWDEICARYPNQWVVLVDLEFVDGMYSDLRSAMVAGHGGNDESFEMAEPYRRRYRQFAHLHTRLPDPPMSWAGEDLPGLSPA